MNPFTGCKVKKMLAPISINGTAATVTGVDCSGFAYALIIVSIGTIGSSTDLDALAVLHADADTGYAALSVDFIRQTGTTNAAVSASSLAWTATGSGALPGVNYTACIDLRKCKKWLSLNIDPAAVATLASACIVLIGGDQAPNTATEMGVQENLSL